MTRASISATRPRALAICDRCSARYNHDQLQWQYQYVGPKLQNLRILVCQSCLDVPQDQLRTIILPADPIPIMNARPEAVVAENNPLSGIGASPNWQMQQYGSFIGTLTEGGGIASAFDANENKPTWMSASISVSGSSFENYVGVNWAGNVSNLNMPADLLPPIITHTVTNYTLVAPNDRGFLGSVTTNYVVQASSDAATWTTVASGTTDGTSGESISGTCTGSEYQYHRIAVTGDGSNAVSVAQVTFDVAETGTITERS